MADVAQDEFNTLVNPRTRLRAHPDDGVSDDDGTTIAASSYSMPSSKSTKSGASSIKKSSLRGPSTNKSKFPYHDDDSEQDEEVNDSPPKQSTYYLPRRYDRAAMTGPKGVIADAGAFEQEKRGGRNSSYERTKELALPKVQRFGGMSPQRESESPGRSGSESLSDIEEDDDERQWKEKRKAELNGPGRTRRKRTYGGLEWVHSIAFLEAVERAGRGAVVAVYIFDDQSQLSDEFANHLADIASHHPSTQFIALHCDDAEIDPAGIPAILAYKDGDKFADLMPLIDEIPFTTNVVASLEKALRGREII